MIEVKSTPNSVASFFAIGLAFTLPMFGEGFGVWFSTISILFVLSGAVLLFTLDEPSGTSSPASPIYAIKSPTGTA